MKITAFLVVSSLCLGVGCAESGSPSDAPAAEEDVTQLPNFKGTGASKDVSLDGRAAKLVPVSSQIAALVKEMTEANTFQNNAFYAGVYAATPANLAAFSSPANSYLAQKNMAFAMMFRIDGSAPGSDQGLGWGEQWRADYETMGCRATTRDKADTRFKRFGAYKSQQGDDQIPIATRNLIKRDATKLVGSFLKSAGNDAKLYSCHWDNNDDTTSEALVLIDGDEARVIVAWEGG